MAGAIPLSSTLQARAAERVSAKALTIPWYIWCSAGQVDARRGRRAGDLTQAARSAVNSIVPAIGPPPLDTATTCAPAT